MPASETVSGLYEFFHGEMYATVEVSRSGDGWISEWWISRNVSGTYELIVLGYVRIPVFGEDKKDAYRRISFIYEDVLNSVASWSGGVGDTGSAGNVVSARKHCRSHLQTWGAELSSANKTEHTAALYSFAVEFGVNNPAALIAEVEVLPSVRTVHDRIAYARRIGILDSYGKGRIKDGNEDRESNSSDGSGSRTEEGGWDSDDSEPLSDDGRKRLLDRILRHAGNSADSGDSGDSAE